MQGAVLDAAGAPSGAFAKLARDVRSGDPDNVEAQAARRYWPLLMGGGFRRDTDGGGANALLNYGYAILRAATARAVMAAGLHPSIGIFHRNALDSMCLVDDLVEPFRPFVDATVWSLVREGADKLDKEAKRRLAAVVDLLLPLGGEMSAVDVCLERLAGSLVGAFESGRPSLVLPQPPTPVELAPLMARKC
jgi:CRISPR-associated protein Cas1